MEDETPTNDEPVMVQCTCGEVCIGFCLLDEVPTPVCDLENPEMCESCM